MTESQTCRMWALSIIRQYAPLEYPVCLARDLETEAIARNVWSVEPVVVGMRRAGDGPLATWLEAA